MEAHTATPIVTVTLNPAIDEGLSIGVLTLGAINRCQVDGIDPGGKGVNASRVITRLGRPTIALGFVGGVTGELTQALRNLEAHRATEGAKLDQVVKTTVFLRHMSDYAQMNEAYTAGFGDHRPARSAVGVAELPIGALVEVEAWAWVGG